ncbi:MAG: hypothetical protein JXA30_12400 [Deltaproteobacteria bacterium]|nr:hypothetical protein [Deltaproteobacteria bacterium]
MDALRLFSLFDSVPSCLTQGDRFDPDGTYVRQWVPELAKMPAKHIHCPWEAPNTVLEDAGVHLVDNYPRPIVDHRQARQRYLDAAGVHLKGGKR